MYEKRGIYRSYEHNGCIVTVITQYDRHRSGISAEAVREGLARIQLLHTQSVLHWRLSGQKNHYLILYLFIPNRVLNKEEANARIDQYMDMIRCTHKRFWHRPSYSGEELRDVSKFMHDLNWYICNRTHILSGMKLPRPRVCRRYVCLELHPERLPKCIGDAAIADIQRNLTHLMPGVNVERSQNIACDGFTLGTMSDMGKYCTIRRQKKRKYRYDNILYSEYSELERLLKEWQEDYDEKVRAATQNWLTNLLDELSSLKTMSMSPYCTVRNQIELVELPVKFILALASKGVKYYLFHKMLERWKKEEKEKAAQSSMNKAAVNIQP